MTTKVYNQPINTNSTTNKKLGFSKLDPVSLVKDKAKNLKEEGNSYPNKFTIDKSDDFDKYKDDEVFTVVDLSFHLRLNEANLTDGTIRTNSAGSTAEKSYSPRFQWVLYPKLSDNHNFVLPFTELTSYGLDEINGVLRVNLETLEASLDGRYFHYNSNYDYSYTPLIYTFYQSNWFGGDGVELPLSPSDNNHLTITLSDVKIDVKRVPIGYLLNEEG